MRTALIIHGHFYQPPRENPWTGSVDREPGAHPFHDWNERIHHECYRANAFSRIADQYGRIEAIVNNYEQISFNFGPTLLSWLEEHHAATYQRILDADRESVSLRGGHGNAIAQGYNHAILPLCNERDRRTQVRWGIEDFRYHFNREPESLWLPETACNDETLGTLIDEGLKYVILSPYQAERVRPLGGDEWQSVADCSIDTTRPYQYFHRDGSGRSIAVFFYDGEIARAIAFDGALASSRALVERFASAAKGEGRVVNVATDGETYGHHYWLGDRGLAHALEVVAPPRGFYVTNYGEFLEQYPPAHEVEIKAGPDGEGTSWSCAHGVGRWSKDCGCQGGAEEGWNQAWRGPFRAALDFLRDAAARSFEGCEGELFRDPWAARDDYIKLLVGRHRSREEFLYRHAGRWLQPAEKERALIFLELQRHAMLMYTSCGWFFADISGIETVQDMKYAGRVLDLMNELGLESPRAAFLEMLAEARSNLPEMGNGADVFRRLVDPCRATPSSVASTLAISGLVDHLKDEGEMAGYTYRRENFRKGQHGRLKLLTGRLMMEAVATTRRYDYALAAMHFGGVDFYCVLQPYPGEERFKEAAEKLWTNWRTASLPKMLRLAQEEFGTDEYGLEHILPEGREMISEIIFKGLLKRFSDEYASLYKENRRRIELLQKAGFELPVELRAAAEFTLGRQFEEEIRRQHQSKDPANYRQAIKIANEAARRGYHLNRSASRRLFEEMILGSLHLAIDDPSPENIQAALELVGLTKKLGIEADLDRAQEAVYSALKTGALTSEDAGALALALGLAPVILTEPQAAAEQNETPATPVEAIPS
jgi:alpha-amylase/alpha-mannosidase (GH57 family)